MIATNHLLTREASSVTTLKQFWCQGAEEARMPVKTRVSGMLQGYGNVDQVGRIDTPISGFKACNVWI